MKLEVNNYSIINLPGMEKYKNLFTTLLTTTDKLWSALTCYLSVCVQQGRVVGKVRAIADYTEGDILALGVRGNAEVEFNDTSKFYNDLLIIYKHSLTIPAVYLFKVTMDPKGRKSNIAHHLEGAYASYTALRPHAWVPGRTAIVQDRDKIFICRTSSTGEPLKDSQGNIIIYKGKFGINIHDPSKYSNSSLGCTILQTDSEANGYQFSKIFKPLVSSATNRKAIDYYVINWNTLESILTPLTNRSYLGRDERNNLLQLAQPLPMNKVVEYSSLNPFNYFKRLFL
jgi:hypothetical protein